MNHRAFRDFLHDDDPPAPQEPPQHHTPLSPPRSRAISKNHASSLGGLRRANSRNSLPVRPSTSHLQYSRQRTRSADETLRPSTSPEVLSPESFPVTKDRTGQMTSITLAHVDKRPSTTEAQPTVVASATTSSTPAGTDFRIHVSRAKNEPRSAPPTCGAQRKRTLLRGISSSHTITPMSPLLEGIPVLPGHPYARTAQAPFGETPSPTHRDSLDADGRSLISTLLDAYCRSEADDAEAEYTRKDDASLVLSDDSISLEYASIPDQSRSRGRSISVSTSLSQPDDPLQSSKSSPPGWEGVFGLPSGPPKAPGSRNSNSRPLPQLPPTQRHSRPLPSPPAPPPYTSPPDSTSVTPPPTTSSRSSASSSATSSPTSTGSTSITSVSTVPSTSSAKITSDRPSSHPNISKRPSLAPIVTYPTHSLSPPNPSPLTPEIPIPPSPHTAKLHQASKLSKMLGEAITPALLDGRQANKAAKLRKVLGEDITPDLLWERQAPTPSHLPVTLTDKPAHNADKLQKTIRPKPSRSLGGELRDRQASPKPLQPSPRSDSLKQQSVKKPIPVKVEIFPAVPSTPTPPLASRGTETPSAKTRPRTVRPQAIYVDDNTSEATHEEYVTAEDEYAGSVSDVSASEETAKQRDAQAEDLDDQKSLSSASGLTVGSDSTSLSESLLEELDDFEEARIGWALQNFITYEKASRVKRTSKMWVLEKDGQRWEGESFANVRGVVRQA